MPVSKTLFTLFDQLSMNLKIICIVLFLTTLSGCKPALCEPEADNKTCNFPKRTGHVNDFCLFLTDAERDKLEATMADYHAKTGTQIIVVVEDSKKTHSRKFHCPQAIAVEWKLGAPENFDGFLIAISRKRTYVDFSYGLKFNHKLNPDQHNHLLYEIMVPAFKRKAYYEGLQRGTDYFISCQTNRSSDTKRP